MTTMITRQRHCDSEDKDMEDKCNDYDDGINVGQEQLELSVLSEGSSGSSIAEMNNNTNGKTLAHVNINGNRQYMQGGIQVEAPPVNAAVMKRIKQIYMDQAPLHLSGLSLSGSGMELFVKLDEKLDKALRQANSTMSAKRGRRRKKLNKNKKPKNYLQVDAMPDPSNDNTEKHQGLNAMRQGLENGLSKDQGEIQARDNCTGTLRNINSKMDKTVGEPVVIKETEVVPTKSKPSVTECIRKLRVSSTNQQQSYYHYGWNQNFQPSSSNLQNNVIRGPIWNIDNGHIDVIRPQDTLPSTSNVQTAKDINYDTPIDYTINPFPDGFKSKNLPLKRRLSPPRWRVHNVCHKEYEDNYDDNICANKEFPRKESYGNHDERKVRKLPPKTVQNSLKAPVNEGATTAAAALLEAEAGNRFFPNNVKQTSSNVSNGQQSSVGPQFQTELLTSQTMDAETLLKFTEYTHALRKDLKQKYKDLSKLVKAFEATVEYKNNFVEESNDTEQQVGRCRIM